MIRALSPAVIYIKNPNVNWGTVTHYPGQCVAGVIPQLSLINKESKGKIK